MKRIVLLFTLLALTIINVAAQQSAVSGRLIDPDNLSVPGVAVVMQTTDSVYVDACVSDAEGYFRIESAVRPYRLLIQHIAYKTLKLESDKSNLGDIRLEEAVNELSGVVVKADRPIVKMDNGKLAYDLGAISEGKLIDNTFDLVKELPGITNEEGGIKIIGDMGGTDILISGKKSNMSTDQIIEYLRTLPPNQVEKIEVVYNPPASWHVKGSAINIVLKKENNYSLQGQVQGRYTNRSADSYIAGGSLFFSSPHWAFDLIYNFNDNRRKDPSTVEVLHTLADGVYDIDMDVLSRSHHQYHNVYSSLKYNFTNKSLLDLSYVGQYAPKRDMRTWSRSNYFTDSYFDEEKDDYLHDISLTYTSSFGLKTGAEYTHFQNTGSQMMQHLEGTQATDMLSYQVEQEINRANVFADMEHALPEGWQLSYGAKYDYTENTNIQRYEDKVNNGEGNYDNTSTTKEHITNAHIGLSKSFLDGKLRANVSLAGEFYKINDYKKNVLLPNVSLGYTLNPRHSFQFGYRTFRVYPSYWERQEYTTYEDDYSLAKGNPLLRPSKYEFFNLLYILRSKYTFQVAYQTVDDIFLTQDYQSPDVLQKIRKTVNVDSYSTFLMTVSAPFKVGDIWSANLSGYFYNERYKTNDWFGYSYDRNKWVGFFFMNNTVTLLKEPRISLNAQIQYKTPYILGIWDMGSSWSANAGIKWEIIKDRAILNFQCTDIFNTSYPMIEVRFADQHQTMDYTPCERIFMLSFTYSFKGYKERRAKNVDTSRYGM